MSWFCLFGVLWVQSLTQPQPPTDRHTMVLSCKPALVIIHVCCVQVKPLQYGLGLESESGSPRSIYAGNVWVPDFAHLGFVYSQCRSTEGVSVIQSKTAVGFILKSPTQYLFLKFLYSFPTSFKITVCQLQCNLVYL